MQRLIPPTTISSLKETTKNQEVDADEEVEEIVHEETLAEDKHISVTLPPSLGNIKT